MHAKWSPARCSPTCAASPQERERAGAGAGCARLPIELDADESNGAAAEAAVTTAVLSGQSLSGFASEMIPMLCGTYSPRSDAALVKRDNRNATTESNATAVSIATAAVKCDGDIAVNRDGGIVAGACVRVSPLGRSLAQLTHSRPAVTAHVGAAGRRQRDSLYVRAGGAAQLRQAREALHRPGLYPRARAAHVR